jgi:type VI protein secretion system component Hcp
MTTQPENKDKTEQKVSKDELSEKELDKASGGVSLSFPKVEVTYKPQNDDGTKG